MTDTEEALALLAAPCTDKRFFQRALRALALVTQCRWAGFGRLKNASQGEVIAFCDNKQSLPGFDFELAGSPCESLYQQQEICTHLLHARDLQKRFPHFSLFREIGAQSYQAELILGSDGKPVGHIFVLDTLPQAESAKSKEFFRILAQRIGLEYHRMLVSRELTMHKQMIATTDHLLAFIGTDYCYHMVSKGYEQLFNRTQEEIIGKQIAELHGVKTFEKKIRPLLERAFNGETPEANHWLHPPHLTAPLLMSVRHSPCINDAGEICGVIVSSHDITRLSALALSSLGTEALNLNTGSLNTKNLSPENLNAENLNAESLSPKLCPELKTANS
ncbi:MULTISPECIES: PAS domain-containing protein [Shewanella]|uniref:PAS domain-containing protein n=1 Tax=Shewanella TaxID=22 RepID=UPI000691FE71|nr:MULTISPECIES: PAS domain-containing protein [Shewanella]NDO73800.1 PAS domain-containing protein [Shewanella sp. SE1]